MEKTEITRERLDEVVSDINKLTDEQKTWMLVITSLLVVSLPESDENDTAFTKAQEKLMSVLTAEEKELLETIQTQIG